MRGFDEIFDIAAARKGDAEAVNSLIDKPKSVAELSIISEDRWLAILTKCVFQAGFNWKVIEAKWDGFEASFDGFDVGRCAFWMTRSLMRCLAIKRSCAMGPKLPQCARMPPF